MKTKKAAEPLTDEQIMNAPWRIEETPKGWGNQNVVFDCNDECVYNNHSASFEMERWKIIVKIVNEKFFSQERKDQQEDDEFKRDVNKKFTLAGGYERAFCKCELCKTRAYYDYVPYSISRPVITTQCGHDFRIHYKSF